MLVIYILKMLPNSRLLDFPIRAYFILSAAKTQPLPIMVSFILISFTSAVREIPLMYRLSDEQQRKVVKQLWGSAYAFGFSAVLVVFLIIPAPCLLWFHIAAANADLVSHKKLQLHKIIET